ncbi:MAG: hypothetical protein MO853_11615 [Candidatus Protistobacter heckmanni]|nr:hypothetical protein [Candidatus Protistobacter heckmanni]
MLAKADAITAARFGREAASELLQRRLPPAGGDWLTSLMQPFSVRDGRNKVDSLWKAFDSDTGTFDERILRLTDRLAETGAGTSREYALVAARSIKEAGYPHPVMTLCAEEKLAQPLRLNHYVVLVFKDEVRHNMDSIICDPYLGSLSKAEMMAISGGRYVKTVYRAPLRKLDFETVFAR